MLCKQSTKHPQSRQRDDFGPKTLRVEYFYMTVRPRDPHCASLFDTCNYFTTSLRVSFFYGYHNHSNSRDTHTSFPSFAAQSIAFVEQPSERFSCSHFTTSRWPCIALTSMADFVHPCRNNRGTRFGRRNALVFFALIGSSSSHTTRIPVGVFVWSTEQQLCFYGALDVVAVRQRSSFDSCPSSFYPWPQRRNGCASTFHLLPPLIATSGPAFPFPLQGAFEVRFLLYSLRNSNNLSYTLRDLNA